MSALEQYEVFLRQELPYSLRAELNARLDRLLDDEESSLRTQLPTIFRDLQVRLFQEYREQRQVSSISTEVHHEPSGTSFGSLTVGREPAENAQLLPDSTTLDATVNVPGGFWLDTTGHEDVTWPSDFNGAMFELPPLETADSGYWSHLAEDIDFSKGAMDADQNTWLPQKHD